MATAKKPTGEKAKTAAKSKTATAVSFAPAKQSKAEPVKEEKTNKNINKQEEI